MEGDCAMTPYVHKVSMKPRPRRFRLLSICTTSCAVLTLGTTAACTPLPKCPTSIDLRQYRQTFDEPFNTLDVTAHGPDSRWTAHTPWNGDFGDATFVDPQPGFPFSVQNGLLTIHMKRDAQGKWRSGLLSSSDSQGRGFVQSTGYFEMRAVLPKGDGVFPAFWLGSIGKKGTPSPEIDVMEYYGRDPTAFLSTTHLWTEGKSRSQGPKVIKVPPDSLTTKMHRYGVSVESDVINIFFDGRSVACFPSSPEYLQPKMLLLNLAAGGGWPIDKMPDDREMTVDYVRAYVKRPRR
ncbi:MAG: glycoside hydrolase family 16 protein [Cytophagaceae bacterium]|nr:MAG: glycoside hydrolase family 16 protein [Cytophagaceae bacterium]